MDGEKGSPFSPLKKNTKIILVYFNKISTKIILCLILYEFNIGSLSAFGGTHLWGHVDGPDLDSGEGGGFTGADVARRRTGCCACVKRAESLQASINGGAHEPDVASLTPLRFFYSWAPTWQCDDVTWVPTSHQPSQHYSHSHYF